MNLGNLFGAAGTIGSVYGALDNAKNISNQGNEIQNSLNTMGQTAANNSAFQGYGVTSNLGSSSVGADGSVNLGVGQNQGFSNGGQNMFNQATNSFNAAGGLAQSGAGANDLQNQGAFYLNQAGNGMYGHAGAAFQQAQQGLDGNQAGMLGASQQAMSNAMQSTAGRERDIYNRTMAMQNPALDAAQAQQQAREYAMGRGGVMGSQFGGTAEDAAMAKARAQAGNQAAFGAMQQAQAEQLQQANIANGFNQAGMANYEGSFMPMQQQMALMQLAGADADRAQTGQLTGQGYLTQLGLGGAQTNINAQNVAAQLKGNLYDSILDNLGGSSTSGGGMSGIVGMLEGIFK